MAKYYGEVGFGETVNTNGVWNDHITVRHMSGDIVRDSYRYAQGTEKVNMDKVLVNTFSLIADGYAEEHFLAIRYVEWKGVKWKAQSIQYDRPRIIITAGEVWNGKKD